MLEVVIDGVKTKVPQCTCGKCIVRRLRENNWDTFPYNKNLATTYTTDYPWKTPIKDPGYYNRSMHNGFEDQYKEHLPNGMTSEMKAKYIPFEIEKDNGNKEPIKIYSTPFIGTTTNEIEYPNWGAITSEPTDEVKFPDIQIPFRGSSNYADNYKKYPDQYYQMREPLKFAKDNLKFAGELNPNTTYNTEYTPKQMVDNNADKNPNLTSYAFVPCENAPDNFDTTYRTHYVPYEDGMCKLRKYLNARGMRYLVI